MLTSVHLPPPPYLSEPLGGQRRIRPTSQWGRWAQCRCCWRWCRTPRRWSTPRSTRISSSSSSFPKVQLSSEKWSQNFEESQNLKFHTFHAPWMRKAAKTASKVKRMTRSSQTKQIAEMSEDIAICERLMYGVGCGISHISRGIVWYQSYIMCFVSICTWSYPSPSHSSELDSFI